MTACVLYIAMCTSIVVWACDDLRLSTVIHWPVWNVTHDLLYNDPWNGWNEIHVTVIHEARNSNMMTTNSNINSDEPSMVTKLWKWSFRNSKQISTVWVMEFVFVRFTNSRNYPSISDPCDQFYPMFGPICHQLTRVVNIAVLVLLPIVSARN